MFFDKKNNKINDLLPLNVRHDDVYIVSYPRSGSVWLSFLIANVVSEYLELKMKINFFNIHHFVPDVHFTKTITDKLEFFPFRRFIKSHSNVNHDYKYIFLLVRSPFSVMVSYYKFLSSLGKFKGEFSFFLRNEEFGLNSWLKHTEGWLNDSSTSQRIHLFFYEDFLQETERELKRLFDYLGVCVSREIFEKAILRSSFDEMKKIEKDTLSFSLNRIKDFEFVRRGKIDYKVDIKKEDEEYIDSVCRETIEKLRNIKDGKTYF